MMQSLLNAVIAGIVLASMVQSGNAQYMSYGFGGEDPAVNNYLSARYDYLLQTNPRFRAYRMWKECHTINWPELHGDCLVSFDQYEPMIAGYY